MLISFFVVRRVHERYFSFRYTSINYLRTWFVFDLIAAIPFTNIFHHGNGQLLMLLGFKYFRLTYLVRTKKSITKLIIKVAAD